jgi:hypothetical protein
VADHCNDLVVNQLLGNLRCRTRVSRVVLCVELQRDLLAANRQTLGVDFFNRQTSAVFVVFTQVSNTASKRCDVADMAAALIGNSF